MVIVRIRITVKAILAQPRLDPLVLLYHQRRGLVIFTS